MSAAHRQLRNAVIYLGFSIATSAIGLAVVMILTRILPPSEYGLIAIFFSILFFVWVINAPRRNVNLKR